MAIKNVVTRGYGAGATIAFVVTRGYLPGVNAIDQVAIQMPKTRFREGSNFTATAHFRRNNATATPATVHYRIDCLTTQKPIKDWTEVTTGPTAAVSITTNIKREWNRTERKRLTFSADKGTDNEVIGITHWIVTNLGCVS